MKYHISEDGNVRACRASVKACPVGGAHYESPDLARAAYEAAMAKQTLPHEAVKPAPLVKPTGWRHILNRPEAYPAYLANAFVETSRKDPNHFVCYEEYLEAYYDDAPLGELGEKVNLYAGHWIEAKVGVIDAEVNSWFMHGHCAALALELAPLKTNKIVVFETEEPQLTGERWSHAAALNEDGTCTDIEGVKDVARCAASYNASPVVYDLALPEDRTAFFKLTCNGKDKQAAFNDYYSQLEQAMIRHYAELALHTY